VAWKLIWTEDDAGVADGLATLDGDARVVQDPASATETPAAHGIVKAGADGKIASGWLPPLALPSHASTHQDGGSDEIATATPGGNAIPKAHGDGKLDLGWFPVSVADGLAGLDAGRRVDADGVVVGGTQVLGPQAAAIAEPVGGVTQDEECRSTVALLLSALRNHGLIAT
jgi:hypothetical protein